MPLRLDATHGAVFELLHQMGAECLVGNHEFSLWCGRPLEPVAPDLHTQAWVAGRIESGEWSLSTSIDGVLVTHAGLSEEHARRFAPALRDNADLLASALNTEFAEAVSGGPDRADEEYDWESPLWYRPGEQAAPAQGVLQIAGHTPSEILRGDVAAAARWASRGLHLIDPFMRRWAQARKFSLPAPLRYAVVEDGEVIVVEGEGHISGY